MRVSLSTSSTMLTLSHLLLLAPFSVLPRPTSSLNTKSIYDSTKFNLKNVSPRSNGLLPLTATNDPISVVSSLSAVIITPTFLPYLYESHQHPQYRRNEPRWFRRGCGQLLFDLGGGSGVLCRLVLQYEIVLTDRKAHHQDSPSQDPRRRRGADGKYEHRSGTGRLC